MILQRDLFPAPAPFDLEAQCKMLQNWWRSQSQSQNLSQGLEKAQELLVKLSLKTRTQTYWLLQKVSWKKLDA